jgi:hypothetical protein
MAKQFTSTGNVSHAEIAFLAYQAWNKDGRPLGRDVQYWLEAEAQLKATRHLLTSELGLARTRSPKARTTRTASGAGPVASRKAHSLPISTASAKRASGVAPTGKSAVSPAVSRHTRARASV